METPPRSQERPEPDEDDLAALEDEDEFAELEQDDVELEELGGERFRTVDGDYIDEPLDPAMRPVVEAGGGVAEGFEQSEALLVEHASDAPPDATERLLRDAGADEPDEDRGVYGEADEEHSSERAD